MTSALVVIYILSAAMSTVLSILTIRNKEIESRLRHSFAAFTMCVSIWSFANAIVQLSTSPEAVWFWHELKFIGVIPIPSLLLYFSIRYTKNEHFLNPITRFILISLPIVFLLIVGTNEWTHFFRIQHQVVMDDSIHYVITQNGWAFYANAVYTYLACGLTVVLVLIEFLNLPKYYRTQPLIIAVATLLPLGINLSYITGYLHQNYDFTALAFAVTVMMFYLALFYFRVPEIISLARNKVIDSLGDVILICDIDGRVIDHNQHARVVLSKYGIDTSKVTFQQGFEAFIAMKAARKVLFNNMVVYEISTEEGINYYEYSSSPIDDKGNRLGQLIVFRNVTDNYLMVQRLREIATKDPLTRLYNRSYFTEFVNDLPKPFTIVYGGINSFKLINDSFGTNVGDIILQRVGDVISRHSPENAIVGRYEGDEFVVILPALEENPESFIHRLNEKIKDIKVNHANISICFVHSFHDTFDQPLNALISDTKKQMDRKKLLETDSAKSSIIESLRMTLEQSDYETKQHTDRTSVLASQIGRKLGMKESEIHDLMMLAALHDIGKVAIPDAILLKPAKLTDEEFEIMKTHTQKGYDIAISSPDLLGIAEGILQHHEKFDGTGYPRKLKGEEIHISARIITLVDSFDVMMNERPYKKAMTLEDAITEVKRCSGTHFDPQIVEVLLAVIEENK